MTETANGAAKAATGGGKHKRSPNYPVIPIDEAISKVRLIYAEDRRALADFNAILAHMKYKVREKKGGRSARVVATLKQYGLLDDQNGQYRVSEDAVRIIDLPADSPEREAIIQRVALRPPMINKVLKHYKGEIPSDTTLKSHLIISEEFNGDSAEEFIKVLRRNIALVKPNAADYNAREAEETGDAPPSEKLRMQEQIRQPPAGKTPPPPPPKPPAGQRTYHLYLSPEIEGVLYAPSVMTRTEYEILKSQIDNSLKVILAASVVPDPQGYPRSATWKNADHDQPVVVIGELGQGPDGQRYFKVLESATGIPENELEFDTA